MLPLPRSAWVGAFILLVVIGIVAWWLAVRGHRYGPAAPERIPPRPLPPEASRPAEVAVETVPVEKKSFESPLAGRWYPANAATLASDIQGYIEEADTPPLPDVMALILPHAGYQYSGRTAAAGVKTLSGRSFSRVVVLGPTHRLPMEGLASVPDLTHYATPLGEVPLDVALMTQLRRHPHFRTIPNAFELEHSVQIEVPLLQQVLGEFVLVPIVVGQLDAAAARAMADTLRSLIDADTLVVVSSDFTHYGPDYGYVPFRDNLPENIKQIDMGAYELIEHKDPEGFLAYLDRTGATICGGCPIAVLLAMLPESAQPRLLRYETSGAITGDYTNSVSYLSIAFCGKWPAAVPSEAVETGAAPPALSEEDEKRLLELARRTLAYVFEHGRTPSPEDVGIEITDGMKQIMGAFVTLKKNGELRGCIGEIIPQRPLYKAVIAQTINAAFEDRRFSPVRLEELPDIRFEISAYAQPPRPVASYEDIQLGRDGIVLEKEGRHALFLPQVAPEQGWDLPTTLEHLSRKAGLPPDAWKHGASFSVFQAIVFGEHAA